MKKRILNHSIVIVIAIVLVWRGIWYLLDAIDKLLFNESHWWTSLIGILLGIGVLYIPDKDLKEIEKL